MNTLVTRSIAVEPFLTEDEFMKTKQVVKEFENGVGKKLHDQLVQRASKKKNWVSYVCVFNIMFPFFKVVLGLLCLIFVLLKYRFLSTDE